jgi:hypothetical protein
MLAELDALTTTASVAAAAAAPVQEGCGWELLLECAPEQMREVASRKLAAAQKLLGDSI